VRCRRRRANRLPAANRRAAGSVRTARTPFDENRVVIVSRRLVRALATGLLAVVCLTGSPAAAGERLPDNDARDLGHLELAQVAAEVRAPRIDDWMTRPYLLGDWGGVRTKLRDLGVTLSLTFVSDVQGNPVGGEHHGFREFDDLGVDINLDLAKLVGLGGAQFHVSASSRSGSSLSREDIRNVFNVAQVCCGASYRLVDVYYEQSLFDDRLNVRLGRIAAGDEFLASPLYGTFVQNAFDGNPVGIFFNAPGMTAYPTATWGLRVRATPVPSAYVMAGLFNGDFSLNDPDKHGVDFSMRGPLFAIVEAGYRLNQDAGNAGLPGNYKIGAFYDDHTFPDLRRDVTGGPAVLSGLPRRTTRGNAGFYILVDQMVYREHGPGTPQGLTPFASLVVSPDDDVSTLPVFVNGGLVYQGLIPGRAQDKAAFGVAYGRFSGQLRRAQRDQQRLDPRIGVQDYELALEWTYVIQVTPWLQVQPDVQYIIRPGGIGKIPDALVLGFQFAVTF
jgi:porin